MADLVHVKSAAEQYVRGYLELDTQDAASGSTDPQLASVIVSILQEVSGSPGGVLIDIGAGEGPLLNRLLEDQGFRDAQDWLYVGVDDDEKLDGLHKLARANRLSRRVELVSLADFYADWPMLGRPQLAFCRNVCHELNINETSRLLYHVASNLAAGERFIIQDLMKLPVGERRNACWMPDAFKECLIDCGFSVNIYPQRSRGGNAWFKTSHVDALLYLDDYQAAARTLEGYGLLPTDTEWVAYEWGRTYLGTDRYSEAIGIFKSLVNRDDSDSHYHIHYGRALQCAGKFEEAETVLRAAAAVFSDIYAVRTALGVVLEQNGKLDEATTVLEPLFLERDDNVQAAASLMRAYRLRDMRFEAGRVHRRAIQTAPRQFEESTAAVRAEMMLVDGNPDAAVEHARAHASKSAYGQFILMRTFCEAAEIARGDLRTQIIGEGLAWPLPKSLDSNGLVQAQKARLEKMAGASAALEATLEKLKVLGISETTISRLVM